MAKSTVLMNVNQAPWKSGDFLAQKTEMLALALDTVTKGDERFGFYAESMCFDQGLPLDTDPDALLEVVARCKTFVLTGSAVG